MDKRKRVGVPFLYNEEWIAGSYYIKNLIGSLRLLDDSSIPELVILSWDRKDFDRIQESGYPYLKYLPLSIPYSIADRVVNRISRILTGKDRIVRKYSDKDFDVVFPYQFSSVLAEITHKIYWIPDFQNRYFPQFFSEQEVVDRRALQDALASSGISLIFSSENARDDFRKFYPQSKSPTYVLHFASTHPEYASLDMTELRKKYNLPGPYFISPNQFWKHKNHLVVLKAVKLLKENRVKVNVAFTGKEYDSRNPHYFDELRSFVSDNDLQDQVRFLGFIDRRHQLKLMSEALAVIQPSLFEGWSTVVEDAKEMNQYVILSDIGVHREQLNYNVSFFDPYDETDLMKKMVDVMRGNITRILKDYNLNVRKFGTDFMKIIDQVISE